MRYLVARSWSGDFDLLVCSDLLSVGAVERRHSVDILLAHSPHQQTSVGNRHGIEGKGHFLFAEP